MLFEKMMALDPLSKDLLYFTKRIYDETDSEVAKTMLAASAYALVVEEKNKEIANIVSYQKDLATYLEKLHTAASMALHDLTLLALDRAAWNLDRGESIVDDLVTPENAVNLKKILDNVPPAPKVSDG